jgi:serine acetyltransferase
VLLKAIYGVAVVPWRFFRHVYIAATAEIGPGLVLQHPHAILIPPGSRIGRDCTIYHEVTLGEGRQRGFPQLADHVVLFPGARLLGGISVGAHSLIGANTVVQRDVADGVFVTPPAPRQLPAATSEKIYEASQVRRKQAEQEPLAPGQPCAGRQRILADKDFGPR